jgi:hypothetical protein
MAAHRSDMAWRDEASLNRACREYRHATPECKGPLGASVAELESGWPAWGVRRGRKCLGRPPFHHNLWVRAVVTVTAQARSSGPSCPPRTAGESPTIGYIYRCCLIDGEGLFDSPAAHERRPRLDGRRYRHPFSPIRAAVEHDENVARGVASPIKTSPKRQARHRSAWEGSAGAPSSAAPVTCEA